MMNVLHTHKNVFLTKFQDIKRDHYLANGYVIYIIQGVH